MCIFFSEYIKMASNTDQIVDILKDSELIKWSVIQRMELNPKIREENAPPILSNSQTLLQQHEIKRLIAKYKSDNRILLELLQSNKDKDIIYGEPNVDTLILNFKELIEESDNKSIQMLSKTNGEEEDKNDEIYNMMTYNKEGIKLGDSEFVNIQSLYTSDIHLSNMFINTEDFGFKLDLHPNFNEWLQLPRKEPLVEIPTYFQYIKGITKRDTNLILDDQMKGYLLNLHSYLHSFWLKTNPLLEEKNYDINDEEFEIKDQELLICLVCNINFTKEGPMNNHMNSKKHLNKCKSMEIQSILKLEHKIKTLVKKLQKIYDSTVSEIERINLLTTREWQLEQNDKKAPKSPSLISSNIWDQIENTDQDSFGKIESRKIDDNPLNLPMGPDGKPIPYWLYKMRGLRREFKCEICGNKSYKGRGLFTNHFQSKRHIDGLKMIGVNEGDYHLFDDLATIEDVKNLLEEQSNEKIRERKFETDVEQIEVDNGDVLSKKVFNQLQKQGLI